MLPPMLPLSAVPITSQQDPIRPRPEIAPVAPVQESSSESTIDLQKRVAVARPMMTRRHTWRFPVTN